MPHQGYNTLEDLVFSRSFRDWVLKGDTPEGEFWTNWAALTPERMTLVNQAKAVIIAFQLDGKPLSGETVDVEVEKVLQKLRDGRLNLVREIPFRPGLLGRRLTRGWTAAAFLAGLAVIGILAASLRYYFRHRHEDFYGSFLAVTAAQPIRQQTADTGVACPITLPDGSTVLLTRGSRLSYPESLLTPGHKRMAYLEGEASFTILPGASDPFYVYTRYLVVRVLGTGFTVNTTGGKTVVSVTTGKVSVYHRPDLSGGIVLTPNQQLTWSPDRDHPDRTLIARPRQLGGTDSIGRLQFDSTPVATVFRRLQGLYGINILYEDETVSGRSLSVTLGKEPFYEKLNIICKAIDASWESIDGNILITTNGRPAAPRQVKNTK
jgi:ferric-dicitrate binding protein FerR (iron transport regulator)